MFGGGNIDVKNIDGELYINMWQLTQHILDSAYVMKDMNHPDANTIASTLGELAATLSELAIYTIEKDEIDNVENVLASWLDIAD